MKSALKLILPLAVIVLISIVGGFQSVPLWACVFVGAGIQVIFAFLIDLLAELRR